MKFALELDSDSGIMIGPVREADLYQCPGGWYVRMTAFSRIGEGVKLKPAQARAVAQQLLAVADEVEALRRKERR